jgi:hypothetical protein
VIVGAENIARRSQTFHHLRPRSAKLIRSAQVNWFGHSQDVEKIFFFPSSGSVLAAAGIGWLWCGKEVPGLGVVGLEDVVPIVLGGAESAKRGVQSDHLFRHGVTCGVRIKTTVDGKVLG